MFIRKERRTEVCNVRQCTHDVYVCVCDVCGIEFETRKSQTVLRNVYQFHSKECTDIARAKGGLVDQLKRKTNIERYGVELPIQNTDIKHRAEQTHKLRFGVEHPLQHPRMLALAKQTCVTRYGVEHPAQLREVADRAIATRLDRMEAGVYVNSYVSKPEVLLREAFQRAFGDADIVLQKRVHKWPIDIYVKSLDVYVEYDGDYTHGLYERALQYEGPRKKFMNDRAKEAYFAQHGMTLVRIAGSVCDALAVDEAVKLVVSSAVNGHTVHLYPLEWSLELCLI